MSKVKFGKTQPNPKEYKMWIDDDGVIKTFDGVKWDEI